MTVVGSHSVIQRCLPNVRFASLAYVEEDGLLLSVGFLAAIILIGLGSAAVWGALVGAMLISA
jgi:hypothetical protein